MKMVYSTIIDLRSFLRRRDLHPGVNGSVGRSNFSRYGPLDLASPDRSWIFFLMVAARSIILVLFIPSATSSTMVIRALGSPATSTRLFGYFSLSYWCWYSCRRWLTTSMVARVHVALALRLKLKLWENLRWYFLVYGLVSIFGFLQKSTRLCLGRRKSLKTSKICYFLSDFIL
jgi:hypothetical protein